MPTYQNKIKTIANEFIKTVSILDDEAGYETSDVFQASDIIKAFADKGKLCSVYKVKPEDRYIADAYNLSKVSDVTIVDWIIKGERSEVAELVLGLDNEDDEADSGGNMVNSETRFKGFIVKGIIRKYITDSEANYPKLLIIYTSEPNPRSIVEEIKEEFSELRAFDGSSLVYKGLRVVVLRKSTNDTEPYETVEPMQEAASGSEQVVENSDDDSDASVAEVINQTSTDLAVSIEDLPDRICDEFSKLTGGLVETLVIQALAGIRNNAFKILGSFDKKVDAAYLAHKTILPTPEDAHELLAEIIGSEIKSAIPHCSDEYLDILISHFVKEHLIKKSGSISVNNQSYSIEELCSLINKGALKKQGQDVKLASKENKKTKIKVGNDIVELFRSSSYTTRESHLEFAGLASNKRNYENKKTHFISLGIMIQNIRTKELFVCIHPKCDCVRLNPNSEHNIIFVKLEESLKEHELGEIVILDKNYTIDYKTSKIFQLKFKADRSGLIKSKEAGEFIVIKSKSGRERYKYIGHLKNDFAQDIANKVASIICRVGRNPSEWLRIQSK